jgi:hypothetical protein
MHSGTANLPLHGGHAPRWLFERMVKLSAEIASWIVVEQGSAELFRRLSDPVWFQAFGAVIGMDWHSSGVTTTVCGALKQGLQGRSRELGLVIAGGKGRTSRRTPDELAAAGPWLGLDPAPYIQASRMAAKVDNNALQDGYQIYHHVFLLDRTGHWAVVQQGMNDANGYARRYHWFSADVHSFVDDPHSAIASEATGAVWNLVAHESAQAREVTAGLAREQPEKIVAEVAKIRELTLPAHHDVKRRCGPQAIAAHPAEDLRAPARGLRHAAGHARGRRADAAGAQPGRRAGLRRAGEHQRPGALRLRPRRQGWPPLPGG